MTFVNSLARYICDVGLFVNFLNIMCIYSSRTYNFVFRSAFKKSYRRCSKIHQLGSTLISTKLLAI